MQRTRNTTSWECAELEGAHWEPILSSFSILSKEEELQFVGFCLNIDAETLDSYTIDHPFIVWNREHAKLAGFYALRLAGLRTKRRLTILRGWPGMVSKMYKRSNVDEVMALFQKDKSNYLWLGPAPTRGAQASTFGYRETGHKVQIEFAKTNHKPNGKNTFTGIQQIHQIGIGVSVATGVILEKRALPGIRQLSSEFVLSKNL